MVDGSSPGGPLEHGGLPSEPELGPYHPIRPGLEALTFAAAALLVASAARFVINKVLHHEENHAQ
jgi:hypothetical protein